MKIAAYIMAKNEAANIGTCINHLKWCDEVIVADTGSTDATIDLAKQNGASVIKVPFEGFGKTRNKILEQVDADWIVCFDADEVCTEDLSKEILVSIKEGKAAAFIAPRQNFLLGKKIKHSGWYPDYRHPICFKKEFCRYDDRAVHEGLVVNGKIKRLKEPFAHFSHDTVISYMEKTRKYASLAADQIVKSGKSVTMWDAFFHGLNRFFRHFFLKLGFLDGWAGLLIASTSAYGTFIRYARAYEKINIDSLFQEKKIPSSYLR